MVGFGGGGGELTEKKKRPYRGSHLKQIRENGGSRKIF